MCNALAAFLCMSISVSLASAVFLAQGRTEKGGVGLPHGRGSSKEVSSDWEINPAQSTANFWTQDAAIVTYGSETSPTPSGRFNVAYVNFSSGQVFQHSELEVVVTITEQAGNQWGMAGIVVRATANGQDENPNAYACYLYYNPGRSDDTQNTISIRKLGATSNTWLASDQWANSVFDIRQRPTTLKLTASGNVIKCYMDGVQKVAANDNSFTSGMYGLITQGAPATFRFTNPTADNLPFLNDEHNHCVTRRTCLDLLTSAERSNSTFMCLCVYQGHQLVREGQIVHWSQDAQEDCQKWRHCLMAHRSVSEVVMTNLLTSLEDQTSTSFSLAALSSISSTMVDADAKHLGLAVDAAGFNSTKNCVDPSEESTKEELLGCDCLTGLVDGCGGPFEQNQTQCLNDFACCHTNVCQSWKTLNCFGSPNCTKFDDVFSTAAFSSSASTLLQTRANDKEVGSLTQPGNINKALMEDGFLRRAQKSGKLMRADKKKRKELMPTALAQRLQSTTESGIARDMYNVVAESSTSARAEGSLESSLTGKCR